MAEPWFENPNLFAAMAGTALGVLGGVAGSVLGGCSFLVQQGRGRRWVLGGYVGMMILGMVLLAVGAYALAVGQPYAIWFPLALPGLLMTILFGVLYPVIRTRYAEAEQRKIDAEGLRAS